MKGLLVLMAVSAAAASLGAAGADERIRVSGDYVEARTAEVFAGGCIMNSQAETMGRQAVLAWRVEDGIVGGVDISGLAVVAALSGDHNLGMHEMGGAAPTEVKTLIYVDERASAAQRQALVTMARGATSDLAIRLVDVQAVPITFSRTPHAAEVVAGDALLRVDAHVHHDPSCGAMRWFNPLSRGADAVVGLTRTQAFTGQELGSRWRQADRKSAFVGTFRF